MAEVDFDVNRYIAHMPALVVEVRKAADEFALKAEGLFAAHDRPGGHSIEVTHDGIDSLISLVGPAPLSVEYGHAAADGSHVEGLHILSRAAL
jgi:hypothetical protein